MDSMLQAEIENINRKLGILSAQIQVLLESDNMRLMDVSDIARMLGVSRGYVYQHKYLLPNFGNAKGVMEWTKKEVSEWLNKGTDNLRQEYLDLAKQEVNCTLDSE